MTVTTSFIHSSLWPALQVTVPMYRNMSIYHNTLGAICWYGRTQYRCSSTRLNSLGFL